MNEMYKQYQMKPIKQRKTRTNEQNRNRRKVQTKLYKSCKLHSRSIVQQLCVQPHGPWTIQNQNEKHTIGLTATRGSPIKLVPFL